MIYTLSGYFNGHLQLCATCADGREAWEKLEEEYKLVMKRYRYSSYEAFRSAKSRYYKSNRD